MQLLEMVSFRQEVICKKNRFGAFHLFKDNFLFYETGEIYDEEKNVLYSDITIRSMYYFMRLDEE